MPILLRFAAFLSEKADYLPTLPILPTGRQAAGRDGYLLRNSDAILSYVSISDI